jgi:ribosomal protein S27AE
MISEKAGFSFKEDELSPELRKKISNVAAQLDKYYSECVELEQMEAKEDEEYAIAGWCCLSGIIGLAVLIYGITQGWATAADLSSLVVGFGICIVVIIGAFLIMPRGQALADKRRNVASLWSTIESRVDELAKEVESELWAVQEAKVRPTVRHVVIDFARIIEAARGRGIILDKVECPHCGGIIAIPASGEQFKCEYCGKTVYATSIFDKLKNVLSPKNSGRQENETD